MGWHCPNSCHLIPNQRPKWKNLSRKVIPSLIKGIKNSSNPTLKAQTGPSHKKNTFSTYTMNWATSGPLFLGKWTESNLLSNVDLTTASKIIFIHDSEKDSKIWTKMLNKILENDSRKSSSTLFSKSSKPQKMGLKTITSVRPILQSAVLVFSV